MWPTRTYFNPRTPCGVRRIASSFSAIPPNFNPRTPCGVRPAHSASVISLERFQSTHPLRGATLRRSSRRIATAFQSTHPLRGATGWWDDRHVCAGISIHAPLAGCDSKNAQKLPCIFETTDKIQDISDRTPPVKVSRSMLSAVKTVKFRCEPSHKTMYTYDSHYTINVSSGK